MAHLDEFGIQVVDSAKIGRPVAVTFSDHCFTESPGAVNPALVYPGSKRNPGHFSFDRYACSLGLPEQIRSMSHREVWNVEENRFAFLPLMQRADEHVVYRIVFSLHRVKNLPVKLRIHVETAYPADPQNPTPLAT